MFCGTHTPEEIQISLKGLLKDKNESIKEKINQIITSLGRVKEQDQNYYEVVLKVQKEIKELGLEFSIYTPIFTMDLSPRIQESNSLNRVTKLIIHSDYFNQKHIEFYKQNLAGLSNLAEIQITCDPELCDETDNVSVLSTIPFQKNLKRYYQDISDNTLNEKLQVFLQNHSGFENLSLKLLFQGGGKANYEEIFYSIKEGLANNKALKELSIDASENNDSCLLSDTAGERVSTGDVFFNIINDHPTLEKIVLIGTNISKKKTINKKYQTFLKAILNRNVIPNIKEIVLENVDVNSSDITTISNFTQKNSNVKITIESDDSDSDDDNSE